MNLAESECSEVLGYYNDLVEEHDQIIEEYNQLAIAHNQLREELAQLKTQPPQTSKKRSFHQMASGQQEFYSFQNDGRMNGTGSFKKLKEETKITPKSEEN